ncbi:sulfide dehydrogenase cytochrome subunit [Methylohalomonas lacus]|uniref:Sulfide dehydrogenase cytochrome subunit n=1 Tax=Methylohalomonas lacus TaxID=398773 RepID=A0AAE3HLG7_9GAMM|nr:sulfide dehydrogenase cytochrome subunit [Methylohalomonas lacus]
MPESNLLTCLPRLLATLMLCGVVIAVQADDATGDNAGLRRAQMLSFNCFTCHGPEGQGSGEIPALAGRAADELKARLQAYKRGTKQGTIMNRIARGYSDAEIDIIADYFAELERE